MKKNELSSCLAALCGQLKPLSTADDLVILGLAKSVKTLANKRHDGSGPDFIKLPGSGIRYPKDGVIKWLSDSNIVVSCYQRR